MAARVIIVLLLLVSARAHGAIVPLVHAHSHNDYHQPRPLTTALECGFCSIEADTHLVNGQLLVAHDLKQTRPDRTLQSLYLDPLRDRVARNGGRVYAGGPTVTLLVEIKSEPESTYAALRRVLEQYRAMLTTHENGKASEGAITIVLTGKVPRATVAAERVRLVACDGTLADLDAVPPPPADLVPQANAKWTDLFQWRGDGQMAADERQRLRELVDKAHKQGRRIRFWEAPDNAAAWVELRAAGVDLINTDHLPECAAVLRREVK